MSDPEIHSLRHSQQILVGAMAIVGGLLTAAIFFQGNRIDAMASRIDTVITSQSDIRVEVAKMSADVKATREDVALLKGYLLPSPKGTDEPEKTEF